MTIEDWPRELCPQAMDWGVQYNTRVFTSTLTNHQQIATYPGDYWDCTLTFRGLKPFQERILSSFLGRLNGPAGLFRLRDWLRTPPSGLGTVTVDGGGQNSRSLATRGWQANTQVLSRGDYVTVNDQLFEITNDVESDADGLATLPLNIWIRQAPASGDAVNYSDPYAVMRLKNAANPINRELGPKSTCTIECRERIITQ
ncbi:hypothetical protein [Kushneria phosphatilytica]|uniref:Uncharacterized protein n=1 Tax=Kushneria phosphatilytica TaxID=657387 RepID=A0A1S1NS75_9GAMM|nr:hypothetical protein [Kushneria phosphatilytica]OHV12114.1 hypothetical protein BH688_05535 [Kushneria phosphatilytica]QEL11310.1 hypothetical protein FY550_09280 [Kushneria phosphatilytica]